VAKPPPYPDWLKREFGQLVDDLDLEPSRKRFLKSRWLDQVIWTERKANRARNRYYLLRLTTVVGALLVPALVSLNPADESLDNAVQIATWGVSLVVAASAAVEQFFHFGDRWRNYRRTAERLKAEGWLYLQLSGPYDHDRTTHEAAYSAFALRVEELIQSDVDAYLTEVAVEKEKKKGEQKAESKNQQKHAEEAGRNT
jgi:uncharacterized protein DUF4231